jgi:hypothetical protein
MGKKESLSRREGLKAIGGVLVALFGVGALVTAERVLRYSLPYSPDVGPISEEELEKLIYVREDRTPPTFEVEEKGERELVKPIVNKFAFCNAILLIVKREDPGNGVSKLYRFLNRGGLRIHLSGKEPERYEKLGETGLQWGGYQPAILYGPALTFYAPFFKDYYLEQRDSNGSQIPSDELVWGELFKLWKDVQDSYQLAADLVRYSARETATQFGFDVDFNRIVESGEKEANEKAAEIVGDLSEGNSFGDFFSFTELTHSTVIPGLTGNLSI